MTLSVYTFTMSIFAKATPAPTPKTKDVQRLAVVYAVILAAMAIAQLCSLDQFLRLITSFDFPGGVRYAHFIAALLIVAEIFGLPFLLRMSLSPAFRWLSMVLGWLVALIWTSVSLWLVLQESYVNNVGFLGTVIAVIPGWWAIFISLTFGILAGWASWGMWPLIKNTIRVTKHFK